MAKHEIGVVHLLSISHTDVGELCFHLQSRATSECLIVSSCLFVSSHIRVPLLGGREKASKVLVFWRDVGGWNHHEAVLNHESSWADFVCLQSSSAKLYTSLMVRCGSCRICRISDLCSWTRSIVHARSVALQFRCKVCRKYPSQPISAISSSCASSCGSFGSWASWN
jgi:hypothetical protein